ncbi:Putative AP endonuclease 1, endonuclease/exonuclease/phosphatase, AP endonuclease 1, binding protein [Septoria linicola]|uniref:DNA-(apurinic or apyrimidinic site) endonuclease 2 n=1 Tax=Septoria linicola TaxID=215465 RepID=A0A9Q9ALW3_9PEZI|nr:putative AP endonuclease 1, endonuclease/exonuclease/phosphatase, AP endonuclease 1, binding protein [Septoria linicola]USW50469.1 Putative AP endonuclease 1, endonuclease/exonuclease/phosphatase, AP endonuclease 1, binding protein [Septoria linicola]
MRLTTWNVNGIRNPFSYPPWNTSRSYSSMFDILEADIVVMQELKIQRKDLRDDMVLVDGWDCYFSLPKHKKGYSGVGIYTRNATCSPIRAEEGVLGVLTSSNNGTPYRELPDDEAIGGYLNTEQYSQLWELGGEDPAGLDAEGRCVVLEFPAFVLFGVYSPANSNGLRDGFRYGFLCALDYRIRNLIKSGKNVVLVGDLNVTRHEGDSASTLEEIRKKQATREDFLAGPNRRIFNQLLLDGEVLDQRDEGREAAVLWDTTRGFHPDRKGMYTHWDTKINARPGNFGSRIDFVLVAEAMKSWIQDANIQEGLLGSDHCPVYVNFHDTVATTQGEQHFVDVMNPAGVFEAGQRKQEWKIASTPAFSAKRMPEFDKRRSIKSMFAAPQMKKAQSSLQESQADETPEGDIALPQDVARPAQQKEMPTSAASPVKRKASIGPPVKEPPIKRQKSDAKTTATKGQQSLKGFFQAKNPPPKTKETSPEKSSSIPILNAGANDYDPELARAIAASAALHSQLSQGDDVCPPLHEPSTPKPTEPPDTEDDLDISPRSFTQQLASAERTQKSWSSLFARPVAPMCEGHNEPCKSMLTKKKGYNQGRSFWMCARPLGPSGEKDRTPGSQWRCPTFIWCSDWQNGRVHTEKNGSVEGSPVKGDVGS